MIWLEGSIPAYWISKTIPVIKLSAKLPEKEVEKKDVSFRARLHSEIGRLERDAIQEKK